MKKTRLLLLALTALSIVIYFRSGGWPPITRP